MKIQVSTDGKSPREPLTGQQHATIVIVANFSGAHAPIEPAGKPSSPGKMINLDPYDIDASIQQFAPAITIDEGTQTVDIHISEIDDFRPEALYRKLDIFAMTRALKQALSDPEKAPRALEIAATLTGSQVVDTAPSPPADAEDGPDTDMFLRLLGRSAGGSTVVSQTVDKLLAGVVGKDAITDTPTSVTHMQQQLDELDQEAMRGLLRNSAFRDVEAAWRSVEWLGQHIESDEHAQIWLLDAGAASPVDWAPEAHSLIRRSLAGEAVSMITVLNDFSDTQESVAQLQALSELAAAAACPVLTGADARLAGLQGDLHTHLAVDASDISLDQNQATRTLRCNAPTIGLGFPRLLLRQPYGKRSDPIDGFEFEELESKPEHEAFFWVSSAIGLALVWLARHLGYAPDLEISDTPMVTYDDGGGQAIKPASEVYLSDTAAEALLSNGFMPLVSRRGGTSVKVTRLQSMGDPPTAL
jgi:type VI secretion system protein ImpC